MTTRITPTPGRVLWYWPSEADGIAQFGRGTSNAQPLAAIVAGIVDDNHINLCVFDAHGNTQNRTNVQLIQGDDVQAGGSFATWMPYQLGQAAKTEEAEAKVATEAEEPTQPPAEEPTPEEAPQA